MTLLLTISDPVGDYTWLEICWQRLEFADSDSNFSMKNENDAMQFGTYIMYNHRKIIVTSLVMTTEIEFANGTLLHVV